MNASLEALWAVYYGDAADPDHFNGGVVVFESSRVFGGDSYFYYAGSYKASAKTICAQVKITHYSGHDVTAFGIQVRESLELQIQGRRDGNEIRGTMWPVDFPGNRLPIVLVHLEDLPNP